MGHDRRGSAGSRSGPDATAFSALGQEPPEDNTLIAVPREWLPIDCDDVTVPEGLGPGTGCRGGGIRQGQRTAAGVRRGRMCRCRDLEQRDEGRCVARFRLFFRLDRTTDIAELRRWAVAARVAGLPVDPAVLAGRAAHLHSAPAVRGMDDPVPQGHWAFVLPGVLGERVSLVAIAMTAQSERSYAGSARPRPIAVTGASCSIRHSAGGRFP